MEFERIVELVFQSVPEFKSFYKEEPDENYYNSFLGEFGLFTRDAILYKNPYAISCLNFTNNIINENKTDQDIVNKMIINVLEILTDYEVTQKVSLEQFTDECLMLFKELLQGDFFHDLTQN